MLTAVNTLFTSLFSDIFVAWLSTDVFLYLFGIVIFGMIIKYVISLLMH